MVGSLQLTNREDSHRPTSTNSLHLQKLRNMQDRQQIMQERQQPHQQQDMWETFEKLWLETRLKTLITTLEGTVFKKVLARCRKVLELEGDLIVDPVTLCAICTKIITMAEQEPYGVRGGTLVVSFSSRPNDKLAPLKIGMFPLDKVTVPTFELHLTLQATSSVTDRIKLSLRNLVRKMGGKPTQMVVDPKFDLNKKKLYKSSEDLA